MDQPYKHILVGLDGSNASKLAFEKAVRVAKKNEAELILAHVVDARTFSTYDWYTQMAEKAKDAGEELLKNFEEEAHQHGVAHVKTVIEFGSAKTTLAKTIASEHQADLIICGATGMSGVDRFIMGSVSEHTARYAKCDVLIVRNQ
ncbi:hypothetical protein A374_05636 [Fictibacillus macauensis ZFHKF-1]|uniref:Universal stress protein n=1 Tax=Fictibacillus macauensis ZFHKF-1 TaxID=1196324 RepID=I8ALC6_9BACL|nr:universal stress protein [Fictibacillus macauensis]EIT86419.1 hypothetical protein A374_05636 [Fictibacillus macauensis ZFHKF-1]